MTRTTMLLVLACFLVVGAAAASIATQERFPSLGARNEPEAAPNRPLANRDNKTDRLAVTAPRPRDSANDLQDAPPVAERLRQAFASASPIVTSRPEPKPPVAAIPPSSVPAKPKLVAKPAPQKTYTLLSDQQIAGIKDRLNLTPSQESYWPGVETALRAIARKIHSQKQSNPAAGSPPIDPDSEEVSQLKSAAMPLLFQLREDQKREVRALARIIGLEAVAARI